MVSGVKCCRQLLLLSLGTTWRVESVMFACRWYLNAPGSRKFCLVCGCLWTSLFCSFFWPHDSRHTSTSIPALPSPCGRTLRIAKHRSLIHWALLSIISGHHGLRTSTSLFFLQRGFTPLSPIASLITCRLLFVVFAPRALHLLWVFHRDVRFNCGLSCVPASVM